MRAKRKKYWMGFVKSTDDFNSPIIDEFIDGKTTLGPWGFMTPESYNIYGIGLGIGYGQKYVKQENGKWLQVEGGESTGGNEVKLKEVKIEKIDNND